MKEESNQSPRFIYANNIVDSYFNRLQYPKPDSPRVHFAEKKPANKISEASRKCIRNKTSKAKPEEKILQDTRVKKLLVVYKNNTPLQI